MNVAGGNRILDFFLYSSNDNNNNDNNPDLVNVVFLMMQGNKHSKSFKKTDTIKYMLESFVKSFGLSTNVLKKIYFLHNAVNLNSINQMKTLEQIKIKNFSKVNVIDINNIIGA